MEFYFAGFSAFGACSILEVATIYWGILYEIERNVAVAETGGIFLGLY